VAWSAFKSYEHYFGKDDSDLIGGISNDQLFFLSYAQKSCVPLSFISLIDTHSPAQARISGTLMNLPEFAKAFNCPTGSKLNPEKKCSLWGSPLSSIQ
jgi:predicted metalloendopeptidase